MDLKTEEFVGASNLLGSSFCRGDRPAAGTDSKGRIVAAGALFILQALLESPQLQ